MGVDDVERGVAFWSAALGYDVITFEGSENDFTILRHPSGDGTRVALQRSDTPAQEAPRVHLDLVVDSATEQQAEVERLVGLGAAVVPWEHYPDAPDFIVLADPDGNRFCIVDASHG